MRTQDVRNTDPHELRADFLSLLDAGSAPWATILLPIEPTRNPVQTNRAHLESVLGRLRSEAATECLGRVDVDALLQPATDLLQNADGWTDGRAGVAIFLGPDRHVVRLLPFAPQAYHELDHHIHVRPLWRHLEPVGAYFILGLSAGGAALHRAWRYGVETIPLLQGPSTLLQTLSRDGDRDRTPTESGGRRPSRATTLRPPATAYAQAPGRDENTFAERLERFFRSLDAKVCEYVRRDGTEASGPPLVLAGTDPFRRLYRRVSSYDHLVDEAVEDTIIDPSTGTWDPDTLRERSWPLVASGVGADYDRACEKMARARDRVVVTVQSVLLSALKAQIDTLFVTEEASVWGQFDDERCRVSVHRRRETGDTELLNAASRATLRTGGTVYVTDADDIPESRTMSALLRA